MTMMKMTPHAEFLAQQAAAIAKLNAERDGIVETAKRQIGDAQQAHHDALQELLPAHEAAIEARIVSFQRWASAQYAPAVEAVLTEPSRTNLGTLASVFVAVESEAQRAIGRAPDEPRVFELCHAIADAAAKRIPNGIDRIANEGNIAGAVVEANYSLLQALRRAGDVAGVAFTYAELERALMVVISGAPRAGGDCQARWDLMRFSGSITATAAALRVFNKLEFDRANGSDAERQAKHGIFVEAQRTREPEESLLNAISRVTAAATAAVTKLVTPEPSAAQARASALRGARAASMDPQPGDDDPLFAREAEAAELADARATSIGV